MTPSTDAAVRNRETNHLGQGIAERHDTVRPNPSALLELLIRELHLVPAELHS
jgi:hypothetical protein